MYAGIKRLTPASNVFRDRQIFGNFVLNFLENKDFKPNSGSIIMYLMYYLNEKGDRVYTLKVSFKFKKTTKRFVYLENFSHLLFYFCRKLTQTANLQFRRILVSRIFKKSL